MSTTITAKMVNDLRLATLESTALPALVIVGESTIEDAVNKAELKAEKHASKELDVSAKDLDKALADVNDPAWERRLLVGAWHHFVGERVEVVATADLRTVHGAIGAR